LKGPIKLKARDALAERLARMTAATLHEKLQEESIEVRRAAALACAMKEDKAFIPSLITLLEDRERPVSLAAHAALKVLTKQDFGPAMNADGKQRATAIARWKEWWKSQAGK
jgi:HEAT repeat protein